MILIDTLLYTTNQSKILSYDNHTLILEETRKQVNPIGMVLGV